jgi:hypothetical protein
MLLKALADDSMVLIQDLRVQVVAHATQESSGALDVGGKEGQGLD